MLNIETFHNVYIQLISQYMRLIVDDIKNGCTCMNIK